jgi:hypothetical protein
MPADQGHRALAVALDREVRLAARAPIRSRDTVLGTHSPTMCRPPRDLVILRRAPPGLLLPWEK